MSPWGDDCIGYPCAICKMGKELERKNAKKFLGYYVETVGDVIKIEVYDARKRVKVVYEKG